MSLTIPTNNNAPRSEAPDEPTLKLMLANNLKTAVENLINIWKLQYRITEEMVEDPITKERKKTGKWILEDLLTGADLWLKKFITADEETMAMKREAKTLSKIDDEVLILGETGTGKELIARAMIGDRVGAFKRINCAAMPKELIESELFGHKAGAFTGANVSKQGLMVAAKDGVLFLDEIGDLPLDTQAKVLNCLQPIDGKRYVRPVGSNDEIEITCRIVCATHRDLADMVAKHLFRIDLYARISTFVLSIKPINQRVEDIAPIVREIGIQLKCEAKAAEFLEKYMDKMINKELSLALNVRSLEQFVKRYSVLGRV
jgi:transcriptional regulator with PAS, ATPase and Fis domain